MNPYVVWIRIAVLIAVMALLGLVAHLIYDAGGDAREAPWLKREAAINADAAARIKAAEERVRAAEFRATQAQADIDAAYQRGLKENDDAKNTALAQLRAGRRLFIGAQCPPAGSPVPDPAAPARSGDGGASAELSEPAAEWLVGLASEADAVARQLAACQAVIRADRP
jgi:prophage endopeptidase